ncbi:hypothetical protein KCM76_12895 [Zooshikella marina]|uniref:hypothetical protein n=1 Tax=Zooshikella ganghwensis TaxID=202772 RepID=UPI001BAFFA24|nr:hypothetical protein [Zooshikella ganghwensis]MBU2706884.1 hypothetical protein [Zooshikella ganghwensis]
MVVINTSVGPITQSIHRESTCIDSTQALEIKRIASNSPACQLNLQPGDLIWQVNHQPASEVDLLEESYQSSHIHYWLYSRQSNATMEISAPSTPLGFHCEKTSTAIVNHWQQGLFDWQDLFILWNRREWDNLLLCCDYYYRPLVIRSFLRWLKMEQRFNATHLFRGAALFEKEQLAKGVRLIDQYVKHCINIYSSAFMSVASLYLAFWSKQCGHWQDWLKWLQCADFFSQGKITRIMQTVTMEARIEPIAVVRWLNRPFPVSFNLPVNANLPNQALPKLNLELHALLQQMEHHQLLPVCLLASKRPNPTYNTLMKCYRTLYKHWGKALHPLIVITTYNDLQPPNQNQTYEQLCFKENIPIIFLADKHNHVASHLQLSHTPAFFLINHEGTVCFEGTQISPYDFWQTLSQIH